MTLQSNTQVGYWNRNVFDSGIETWREIESLELINKLKLNRRNTCKSKKEPDYTLGACPSALSSDFLLNCGKCKMDLRALFSIRSGENGEGPY